MEVASRRALDTASRATAASAAHLGGYLSERDGFLPPAPPSLALPASHAAWDELAAALPAHFRDLSFREAARELPMLDAGPDALPDADVRRAATVLGILAHTWFRVETSEPGPLPAAIAVPWATACARLGRRRPFLEFEDITTANWRFLDAGADDPMRVENLDLLVPTVGNDAERFFMMTLVELAARATPLVGGVVRVQEHMAAGELDGLEVELVALLRTVHALSDAMRKADPNPRSRTHVDPVVWGATVAPFAVTLDPEMPSPGGTAAPLFQVLDALLGRRSYSSLLGEEVRRIHDVSPPLHRAFVDAIARQPLGPFLAASGTRTLRGLARAVLDAYAGDQGLLQLHRVKAYGYLEVAFKVGRPVTLSGFAGVFRDRPWKRVDAALDESMRERRVDGLDTWVTSAALAARTAPSGPATSTSAAPDPTGRVRRVVLDVRGRGVVYEPGDRVAVLPESSPALVARTLTALGTSPDDRVELTAGWRAWLALRGVDAGSHVALAQLLRWATLRPLPRDVAKHLHELSGARALRDVIEERTEDQLELPDALSMMTAAGYDVGRLVRARPWEPESLAAIIPPETERLYSISSAPSSGACADALELTVGSVSYDAAVTVGSVAGGAPREGVASNWLNRHLRPGDEPLPLRVVRPGRFALPRDADAPVVLFAAGTGIAPFRGFLRSRLAAGAGGPNVLVYAARDAEEIWYRDELEAWQRDARLELHLALSRDERRPRRVDELIAEHSDRIWALVGEDRRGHVYICGQAGFAHTVMEALRVVASTRAPAGGDEHVRTLIGEQRLLLDVFTTTAPLRSPGPLGDLVVPASDLVTRNDDGAGYWMAIDGAVYDVTEFRHLHPGGPQILVESAGTDATAEYRAVLHHLNGEIGATLSMYKVGLMRRLALGSRWGIAATATGWADVSVTELYRAWVRYTYLVVEMQNALRNDWSYRVLPLTRGERQPLTAQKLLMLANTHERFVVQYLDGSVGDDLTALWRLTTGLCRHDAPIGELPRAIAARRASAEADAAADALDRLRRLSLVARSPVAAADDGFWSAADAVWRDVRAVQERHLDGLKELLREGLVLFERHEADVVARGGSALVELLRRIPDSLTRTYRDLVSVRERLDLDDRMRDLRS